MTGTRGKSSVTRLLASILREDGRRVLAKTTGSRPCMVLPDGEAIEINRRGLPSIIEQKRVIKKASDVRADCLVAEIMSIHPENHYVESQHILKPNLVVVTNVRADHIEAMGEAEDEIGAVFGLDIPENSTVFITEKELTSSIHSAVQRAEGTLIEIRNAASQSLMALDPDLSQKEFSDNIDLVFGVAAHLHIGEERILSGIRKVRQDVGAFKIWEYRIPKVRKTFFFVNGFAANDPDSTLVVIEKLWDMFTSFPVRLVGLLNLRSDRGDRTLQWIDVLKNGMDQVFERIFVVGGHARVVKRKLKTPIIITEKQPEKIMDEILSISEDHTVIFGCGNMEGVGECLVDYWNTIGKIHGV